MSNNGNINRDLLSCMTKEQLINMILGQQTVSVSQTGSVSQTASTKVRTVHKNKSLVQLAAENLEHSIKRPVILPKQSDKMPTLKTLEANAIFKDKIKYFEKLSDKQSSTIRLDKKAVLLQDMRDEELAKARVSKYMKDFSFQNLFHDRLNQMPGKREKVQITIQADMEHTLGNRRQILEKLYGPFKMEVPKLSKQDVYKFMMYTLLQNNFTVLSTETISEIGDTITGHNEQFFKDYSVGALKINTYFLDKQFQIKQRGDNTCMVDFVWHNCKGKKGFQKYTYQKLSDELQEYAANFPMMTTQELIDWANVSIHAHDSTWRKFMTHIASTSYTGICYFKDHHLYPILDYRLKQMAIQANQDGADNLWKYITDMKLSNKSSKFIMYNDLLNNMDELIEGNNNDKPTLSTIKNHVIILPPDTKVEPVIEKYITRSNYSVEYLHLDNNGRLDGFIDHKYNMYVLNNDYDIRKSISQRLHKI